jgi:hypothetical protein
MWVYIWTEPSWSGWLLWYRPLQSDLKDLSWNGNNGSWYSWTGSFWTVWGKTWAIVNRWSDDYSTQHIVTTLNYAWPTLTICWWVYYNSLSYNNWYWHWVMTNSTSTSSYISLSDRPAQSSRWTVWGNGNLLTATTSATTWAWHFVAWVLTSSWKKIYLNWTQIASDSTGFTTGQWSIWRLWCWQTPDTSGKFWWTNWYVRHCAIWDKELTLGQISDFYNYTK